MNLNFGLSFQIPSAQEKLDSLPPKSDLAGLAEQVSMISTEAVTSTESDDDADKNTMKEHYSSSFFLMLILVNSPSLPIWTTDRFTA